MSAWSIGSQTGAEVAIATQKPFGEFIGKVVRWLPGDIIVLYGAAITASPDKVANSFGWLLAVWVATPILVWTAAFTSGNMTRLGTRLLLAVVAFGLWSIDLPGSGWSEVAIIADNRVGSVLVASVIAILFAQFAAMAERRR